MSVLKGALQVPGDKSISHRALIFAALSKGTSKVYGLSPAYDCLSSADCLKQLGLKFERQTASGNGRREAALLVHSPGIESLSAPEAALFAGNSGTTIRLMSGLVAGKSFKTEFDGDESLRKRPMARVLKQLQLMGASVEYLDRENYPPFIVQGGELKGREFKLQEASAQVQTALLLAGLQADGRTLVELPKAVRDHTARMFKYIGVPFEQIGDTVTAVSRLQESVSPYTIDVPADISSAAFFMVAAACLPGSELLLTNVSLNPGRDLVYKVLKELGADISIEDERELCGEPIANILVKGKKLTGSSRIDAETLAAGIDEIPILALAAAMSEASLEVSDASELRVKESDRLAAIVTNMKAAGADIKEYDDGFAITGRGLIKGGCTWHSYDDHRMAMTGLIAGLVAEQALEVDNESCVAISYPDFLQDLKRLTK